MPDEPWGLDTRHLTALVAIARTQSISRAAEELGYGQSAVSQQLASLERVVGQRLVDRGTGPRPVTLTAAGESLLPHARWILERLGAAKRELESLDEGTSGSLRIGTFQSAGARLLPGVLAAYRSAWPEVSITIHGEALDPDLAALVREGTIDVSFVESTALGPGLDHRELLRDNYMALVPPTHRLANRRVVTLADFAGEDMIDGMPTNACSLEWILAMRRAGVEPNIVFRTDDNPTRQRLIDAGLGCAVLPGITVEPGLPNGGVLIPLEDQLYRTICLAWSSDRTPSRALERFLDTATSVIAEMTESNKPKREQPQRARQTDPPKTKSLRKRAST